MEKETSIEQLLAVIVEKYGPFEITEDDASQLTSGVRAWVDYNSVIHVESFTEEDFEATD